MNKQELLQYRNKRLKKYLQYCYKEIPYYCDIFRKCGFDPNIDSYEEGLKKLPILTKDNLRVNISRMINTKLKLIECNSGGSTGSPVKIFKDNRYNAISRAVCFRNHALFANWFPAEKAVWLWAAVHEIGPQKLNFLSRIKWKINNNILLNTFNYSEQDMEEWLKIIEKEKPSVIYGYASAIEGFAKFLNKKGKDIKGIVKSIISTSEAFQQKEEIEKLLGIKIFDQYGSREVLAIAEECKYNTMHISEDFVIVEVEKDGRVLLTPFESYGMPLIRYEIGDKVEVLENLQCKCGSAFKGMRLKITRQITSLKRNNGSRVDGDCVLFDIVSLGLAIKECQLIQEKINQFKINLVLDACWKKENEEKITSYLKKHFPEAKVHFEYLEKIIPEVSGKKMMVKCLC